MLLRSFTTTAILAASVLALGCGSKPPPKPVAPAADTVEAEAAAKPPPPKCEKLAEHCEAKADTRARVAHSDLYVTPVAGWIYAQDAAATIAQASDSGPVMAFVGYDEDKDAKKDAAARDAAVAEILKAAGVESKPPKKVPWKTPSAPKAGGGDLKPDLWEIPAGYGRGAKKGFVVIVAGSVGEGKGVIGMSFAPLDDKSADDAMLKSFESLGKAK